jgi:hypothetical protein
MEDEEMLIKNKLGQIEEQMLQLEGVRIDEGEKYKPKRQWYNV